MSQPKLHNGNFCSHWRGAVTSVLYQNVPMCQRRKDWSQMGKGCSSEDHWSLLGETGTEAWTAGAYSAASTQCPALCLGPSNPRIFGEKRNRGLDDRWEGVVKGADFNREGELQISQERKGYRRHAQSFGRLTWPTSHHILQIRRIFLVHVVENSRFRQLVAFCLLSLLGKGEFK